MRPISISVSNILNYKKEKIKMKNEKRYKVTLRRGCEVKEIITSSLSTVQEKYCHNGWKCTNYIEINY